MNTFKQNIDRIEWIYKTNRLTKKIEGGLEKNILEKFKLVIKEIKKIRTKNKNKVITKKEIEKIDKKIYSKNELFTHRVNNRLTAVIDKMYDISIFEKNFQELLKEEKQYKNKKLFERGILFFLDKNNIDLVSFFERLLKLVKVVLKIKQKKINGQNTDIFLEKVKLKNKDIYKILIDIKNNFIDGDIIFSEKKISTRKNQNDNKHDKSNDIITNFGWNDTTKIIMNKIFNVYENHTDLNKVFTSINNKHRILFNLTEKILDMLALEY